MRDSPAAAARATTHLTAKGPRTAADTTIIDHDSPSPDAIRARRRLMIMTAGNSALEGQIAISEVDDIVL
jgi:hypothetical protein